MTLRCSRVVPSRVSRVAQRVDERSLNQILYLLVRQIFGATARESPVSNLGRCPYNNHACFPNDTSLSHAKHDFSSVDGRQSHHILRTIKMTDDL